MAEGAVIANLVDMLTGFLRDGVSPIWRVREQVEPLCVELKAMHCFLKDMDGKEGKYASVKNWFSLVRDVAYEAEDLIEGFMIEEQNLAPFRALKFYSKYGKRIAEITSRIAQLFELRDRYVPQLSNPSIGQGSTSSYVGLTWRRTSSFLNDDPIVGFEQHKCNLMKVLLSPEQKLQTILITGMGGSGKTTLAAALYNDAHKVEVGRSTQPQLGSHPKESGSGSYIEPRKHFEFFAWVTVGPDPNIENLLRIILAQGGQDSVAKPSEPLSYFKRSAYFIATDIGYSNFVAKTSEPLSDFNIAAYFKLVDMLLKLLIDKTYLIVFDDVWSPEVFVQLNNVLPDIKNGSRIILTTRQKYFPSLVIMYELKPLNEEESWQLFLRKAFPQSNQQHGGGCPPELEDLGHELSKRCYGLPLALIVLGGLVSRKRKHPAVLIELLESLNWVSTQDGQECLHILALSYWDLPYHLKPCFLYLGAFIPDSEISTSKLIKVWAGDGLISKREGKTHEERGFEYLDELIMRCMVQVAIRGPDNRVKRIRIHGLLSELALSEAKESCFLYVSRGLDKLPPGNFPPRLSFHREKIDFPIKNLSEKLRAFLAFSIEEASKKITIGGHVTKTSRLYRQATRLLDFWQLCSQPKAMKYIRVLELEGVQVKDDNHPEFLEDNMLHLRYLGLRHTNLREFPCWKCNLPCLQMLDIRDTQLKLPNHLWTSKSLEHLCLNSIPPPSISALKSLQTLVGLRIEVDEIAKGLFSLTNLLYLKVELMEASCGEELINSLTHLRKLVSLKIHGTKIPQGVIEATSNHPKLFKLNLVGELQPNKLPAFGKFARYLTQLTLSRASLEQDPMATLKQLGSLRVLKLKDGAYVGRKIICSSCGFSQLQYLKLSRLPLSIFHIESTALPNLTRLSIHKCLTLPDHIFAGLEELTKLQVLKLKDAACSGRFSVIAEFCQNNNVFLRMPNSVGSNAPMQSQSNLVIHQNR